MILAGAAAAIIWVVGENFGAIFTGSATDPNSGLLLALLAFAYWPAKTTETIPRHQSRPLPLASPPLPARYPS